MIDDLDALHERDVFREANELRAWIEVDGGPITDYGHEGRGLIGVTRLKLGRAMAFPAVKFPLIQPEPELGDGWVRFVQTAGGRMGLPAPRRVRGKPFFQLAVSVGMDDVAADPLRRRAGEGLADRRQPVPTALGLRRRGQPGQKSAHDRLREVVPRVVRRAHALGRRGHARVRDRRRVGARARSSRTVMRTAGSCRAAASRSARRWSSRARKATSCSSCWTACSMSRSTGTPVAQVGPGAVLGESAVARRRHAHRDATGSNALSGRGPRRGSRQSVRAEASRYLARAGLSASRRAIKPSSTPAMPPTRQLPIRQRSQTIDEPSATSSRTDNAGEVRDRKGRVAGWAPPPRAARSSSARETSVAQ